MASPAKKPGLLARTATAAAYAVGGKRAAQAVSYTITGVSPETWFGPLQPLPPMAPPQTKGRAFDYLYGLNLQYLPRSTEPVTFSRLQGLAENCPILREVIETRKDQMGVLNFVIRPKEAPGTPKGKRAKASQHQDRIEFITQFLRKPDRRLDWAQWLREVLEQNYVYDAVSIYRRRTRGGQLYSLDLIDGATLDVKVDSDGRTPVPPSVAYQQVLKNLPAVDFSTDELLYYPENPRVDRLYGHPRVAQIITYVDMALARMRMQLGYFTEGNIPDGLLEGPAELTSQQIETLQVFWDAQFAGNVEQRRRAWWVPAGTKWTELKNAPFKDEFDDWLARVICYAFSISPTPFMKAVNRATAQSAQEEAEAEGLRPTMNYISRMMNHIIEEDFQSPQLEFVWDEDLEFDPSKKAVIDNLYARAGILAIDEIRDDIGEEAIGGAFAKPMFATPNGYVPVDPQEQQDMQLDSAQQHAEIVPATAQLGAQNGAQNGGQNNSGANNKKPVKGTPTPSAQGKPGKGSGSQPAAKFDGFVSPLYIARALLNAHDVAKWAEEQGLGKVEDTDDLRLVVANSPLPVDWNALAEDQPMLVVNDGERSIEECEDGVMLRFSIGDHATRWSELCSAGVYTDNFDSPFTGQIQIKLASLMNVNVDAAYGTSSLMPRVIRGEREKSEGIETVPPSPDVVPYNGPLLFGPEIWAPSEEAWSSTSVAGNSYWMAKLSAEEVDSAAADAHPTPSRAQIKAGNYRKGHIRLHGMNISIENRKGSTRSGVDANGDIWTSTLPAHYGYILRTEGADGEHVDAYIGPSPQSDRAWIVNQVDADTGDFDEHKLMLGYDNWAQAQGDYLRAFSDGRGHQRLGGVAGVSIPELKAWLANGDTTEPYAKGAQIGGPDLNDGHPDRPLAVSRPASGVSPTSGTADVGGTGRTPTADSLVGKVYASVDELPQAVKDKLKSPKRRRQWMHVFNSIMQQHPGDESRAFAGAWSVSQKLDADQASVRKEHYAAY